MRMKTGITITAALALSACGPLNSRVKQGLINAGLTKKEAACATPKMTKQLSVFQLEKLSRLGRLKDENIKKMPKDRFLKTIASLKDPEILAVVTTTAVECAF
jgi:hypothetical protein